jgi:hypothetical protein
MRRQRGVTFIGWIFLLTPLAILLYVGIRVGPEYMDYYKVVMAMKETATQLKSNEALSPPEITGALQRRFDTGYIDNPKAKEIVISRSDSGAWMMTADYERTVPVFGNMYITMAFNDSVTIN